MVAAACQRHIKPTAKISLTISATFRPYLSSVEGSCFLHLYLPPVVIFPLHASKADRSSKETPLSYMLNIFDPGLASSNLCLCFKNQITADKEALLKVNLTQSLLCPENLCQGSILIAQTTSADSSSGILRY